MGRGLQILGRPSEALDKYEMALPLFEADGNVLYTASTLRGLGDVLASQGLKEKALQSYMRADKLQSSTPATGTHRDSTQYNAVHSSLLSELISVLMPLDLDEHVL